MNRFHFSLLAALAAGMTIPAAIGRASSPYEGSANYSGNAYASSSGSQLQLVSATEAEPQSSDSPARLADPRGGDSTSTQSTSKTAPSQRAAPQTRPTYYPTARQPVQKPVAPRPADRVATRQPTPEYYAAPRSRVQLTANVVVDPSNPGRGETVMRTSAPPSPEVEGAPAAEQSFEQSPSCGGECSGGICGGSECCSCQSCCGFCAGMDYLYLRPHYADDAAYEQLTATTNPTTVTQDNRLINFDEPYSSDYHFFIGYHNSCGDEFRVGYWHITDDGNRSGVVTGDFLAGSGVAFQAPGGTELTSAGQTVAATTHTTLNLYDFEDYKRIDLPGLGCGCCPGWDVRWSFGLRVIDFKHTVDIFDPIETINNDAYFVGGGPKVGLEVRRQLGHSKFDLFVNTSAALLLGEGRNRSTTTTPGVLQTAVNMNIANTMEKIPDFYIMFGLEWKPCCNTSLTAGWLLEDFGNLGTAGAPTCTTCSTTSGQIGGGDLSFDGLFVRAEHCF